MNLHLDIYMVITLISCIISFVVCIYAYLQKPSKCMTYFMISVFGIFFTNLVSIFEISAITKETALVAVQMGYVGRLICTFFLPKFLMEYCHLAIPRLADRVVLSLNLVLIFIIFTTEKTHLFYRSYNLIKVKESCFFQVEPGIFYYPLQIEIYLVMIFMLILVLVERRKKTSQSERTKYLLLAACIACPSVGLVIYILFVTDGFDMMPCSLAVSSSIFFFAMRKHFLFDITQNGKDYVLDNAKEAVTVIDTDKVVLYFNQAAKVINPAARIGSVVLQNAAENILTKNNKFEKNGMYFESVHTPIHREDGVLVGYLIEARNQTDYYRTIEETNRFREKALHANNAKSEFLANMSHEIRTPINAILGMNEMILRENENPMIEEYAVSIEKAGKSLLSLVNNILDFSRIESGNMEQHCSIYDTKDLLLSCKKLIEKKESDKRVHLNVKWNVNIPKKLYGDMSGVNQLILSSVASATESMESEYAELYFDYMGKVIPNKGYKTVQDMEEHDHKYPEIWLQMKLNDTNHRITKDEFENLTQKLSNGFDDKKSQYDKEELRPAIIHKLITELKAKLYMNLDEDGNVTTTLSIPQGVVDDQPIGEIYDEEFEQYRVKPFEAPDARILVVDDNEVNLKVIRALLKRTRLQITTVNSGLKCLETIKEQKFDLIFMDHLMPEMDGIETFHQCLELRKGEMCPVIVLTANAITGAREKYLQEGFSDYLMKPVVGDELEKCILRYLPEEKIHLLT